MPNVFEHCRAEANIRNVLQIYEIFFNYDTEKYMFKGIYNVYFAGLQYSVVKVIPNMSKIRAHQSYLILNYGAFCNFFYNTPEIFTLKASR